MQRLLTLLDNRRFQIAAASSFIGVGAYHILTTENDKRKKLVSLVLPPAAIAADVNHKKRKLGWFKSMKGQVVELGPGSGINFRYFPKGITWTGVEPNAFLAPAIKEEAESNGFPEAILDIKHMPGQKYLSGLQNDSLDAVVCTRVLGSMDDYEQTLEAIYRVLKPGGRLYFVEYVGHKPDSFLGVVQSAYSKFYKFFLDGAEISRDIVGAVKRQPWQSVHMEQWPTWVDKSAARAGITTIKSVEDLHGFKPLVAGVAVKPGLKRKQQITMEEYSAQVGLYGRKNATKLM